jgi:hypothetical protein
MHFWYQEVRPAAMVDQNSAGWNQMANWLGQIKHLQDPAREPVKASGLHPLPIPTALGPTCN